MDAIANDHLAGVDGLLLIIRYDNHVVAVGIARQLHTLGRGESAGELGGVFG